MKKIVDHFAARPAALTNGLDALHVVISRWANN
jgi:hypothetical protein